MTGADHASARDRAPAREEAALRTLLADGRGPERRDAALGLIDVATRGLEPATVEALSERVEIDDDPAVRQFAVEALGVAGEALDVIVAALEDPEPWVRAEAVVAVSRAADDPDALVGRCLQDDDGWVRRNAVVALGKADALDAETLRARLKEDPHGPVREYAAAYLAAAPGSVGETVTALAAVLARDPDAFVRARAADSLGELGTDRAIEALESQGVADRSDDVRRTAKQALAVARGQQPPETSATGPSRRGPRGRPPTEFASGRPPGWVDRDG